MKFSARDYRMPRYKEIPNVGLYLEQTVKYINECLAPIEISITPSMLSNYVKKGYIDRPVKKQYYADQIAYAIYIVIIKQVLSMDNIASLFVLQKATYTLPVAYDYFCSEFVSEQLQQLNSFHLKKAARMYVPNNLAKVLSRQPNLYRVLIDEV